MHGSKSGAHSSYMIGCYLRLETRRVIEMSSRLVKWRCWINVVFQLFKRHHARLAETDTAIQN